MLLVSFYKFIKYVYKLVLSNNAQAVQFFSATVNIA